MLAIYGPALPHLYEVHMVFTNVIKFTLNLVLSVLLFRKINHMDNLGQ